MAALTLFLLLTAFFTVTAQQRYTNISLGSSLSPITKPNSWLSPSGRFAFGFYKQGEAFTIAIWFAKIPQKTVVWTANQEDPIVSSNSTLLFTTNGELILRSSEGEDKSISGGSESASSAAMLDSGNLVLYSPNWKIMWQSFDYPTNTILQGQRLEAGDELFSSFSETDPSKGRFMLVMQRDGNLVQYPVQRVVSAEYAYWASGTQNAGGNVTLNLDDNGHLYMFNTTGFNIKVLSNETTLPSNETMFYRMTIDVDGILRLYSHNLDQNGNWSITWQSSNDKCDPKGICSVNGFCTLMDEEPLCLCPPGFDYLDRAKPTLGCSKSNTSAEECRRNEEHFEYTINTLENTKWEDDSYSILTSMTEEDCKEACLKDCNCDVAMMFKDSTCRKQKLPLRYGRRYTGDESAKVLVKASINGFLSNGHDNSTKSEVAKKAIKS